MFVSEARASPCEAPFLAFLSWLERIASGKHSSLLQAFEDI